MRYNIRDLYKVNGTGKPFLGDSTALGSLPFMTEYLGKVPGSHLDMFKNIDRRFVRLYGSFEPTYNSDDMGGGSVEDVLAEFKDDILAMLISDMKKYSQFYELTKLEYNPIENYNMVEGGTDTTNAKHSEQSDSGTSLMTNNYGTQTNTSDFGAVENTVSIGGTKTTEDIGGRTDTTTGKVSGYNDTTLVDANASESSSGSQKNVSTEDPRTDSNNTKAHTDTVTTSAREDTVMHEQINPSTSSGTNDVAVDHHLTRTGNIGVTTTQQMMDQEVKFWDAFSFYKVIFDDIIKSMCNLNDGGYDVHLTPLMNVIMKGE